VLFCYKIRPKIPLYFSTKSRIFSHSHRISSVWRPFAMADYNQQYRTKTRMPFILLTRSRWHKQNLHIAYMQLLSVFAVLLELLQARPGSPQHPLYITGVGFNRRGNCRMLFMSHSRQTVTSLQKVWRTDVNHGKRVTSVLDQLTRRKEQHALLWLSNTSGSDLVMNKHSQ